MFSDGPHRLIIWLNDERYQRHTEFYCNSKIGSQYIFLHTLHTGRPLTLNAIVSEWHWLFSLTVTESLDKKGIFAPSYNEDTLLSITGTSKISNEFKVMEQCCIDQVFFFIVAHRGIVIDPCHKSHNAPVPYLTKRHLEQKCKHFCSERCIEGYGTGALWDLWYSSAIHTM